MVPEISGRTNRQENERVHAWFYTEPAPESGLSDADFQTKRIAWSTRISIFLDHFWVNNRFSEPFFWKPTFLDGSKATNFYQCLLKIGILEMVYPWVYHYASHFPHYICCVQHGLKWWSSADYIISWHLSNEVAHRDGAGPHFGQGRFWTFWFGSTTSVIQLRKTNVVYIFVLVFIFLGFDQHNSRVSCKFSLSKWESGDRPWNAMVLNWNPAKPCVASWPTVRWSPVYLHPYPYLSVIQFRRFCWFISQKCGLFLDVLATALSTLTQSATAMEPYPSYEI